VVVTGAATSSTLHESRLKIISRSVESDLESSSEVTKLRLRISDSFFEKNQTIPKSFKKFQKNQEFSERKWNFPAGLHQGRLWRGPERAVTRVRLPLTPGPSWPSRPSGGGEHPTFVIVPDEAPSMYNEYKGIHNKDPATSSQRGTRLTSPSWHPPGSTGLVGASKSAFEWSATTSARCLHSTAPTLFAHEPHPTIADCRPGGGLVGFKPRRQRIRHTAQHMCHALPEQPLPDTHQQAQVGR
jgi:hypothetical protein